MSVSESIKKDILESNNINEDKITVILTAVPPANKINVQEFQISRNTTVASLVQKLKSRYSNCFEKDKSLIFYCGHNFALCPLSYFGDIYDNYASMNRLSINYAISESWG